MVCVLVVDDSMLARQQLARTLRPAGFVVEEAKDGVEALEQVANVPNIGLIICDVNMPRMSGLEFLEKLRSLPGIGATVPVLMLTTEAHSESVQRAKLFGAKGWIVKPFKPDVLITAAKKLTAVTLPQAV